MGKTAVLLVCLLVISPPFIEIARAQQPLTDFWKTSDECLAATNPPFYYPTKPRNCPLKPNEKVIGNPIEACFLTELPDRAIEGGKGWIRLPKDREVVADTNTGALLRLKECCNQFFESTEPIPTSPGPQGLQGLEGPRGPQGSQGPQGLQGNPGPQGLRGPQGLQGKQGSDARSSRSGLWWAIGGIVSGGLLTWLATQNRGGRGDIIINNPLPPAPPPSSIQPPPPQPSPTVPPGPGVTTGPATGGGPHPPVCTRPPC